MDAEKTTEVEMKELTPDEGQEDNDAEKGTMEGTKETEKKAEEKEIKEEEEASNVYCKLNNPTEDIYNASSNSTHKRNEETEKKAEEKEIKEEEEASNVYCKLNKPTEDIYNASTSTSTRKRNEAEKEEEKEEEEEETDVYCKLKDQSENVYMAAPSSTLKHNKVCEGPYVYMKVPGKSKEEPTTDVYRRVHLYKRISAVFIILSLILLAVVLALALKLYEGQSGQKCLDNSAEVMPTYPTIQGVCRCVECKEGWLKFENSCYFLSTERKTWQKSREQCQKMDGDLVVNINNNVQKALTGCGRMLYWIGLRYSENQQWMWVNNTTLTWGYWANNHPRSVSHNLCAILKGGQEEPVEGSKEQQQLSTEQLKNWHSYPCTMVSHYICQKG